MAILNYRVITIAISEPESDDFPVDTPSTLLDAIDPSLNCFDAFVENAPAITCAEMHSARLSLSAIGSSARNYCARSLNACSVVINRAERAAI